MISVSLTEQHKETRKSETKKKYSIAFQNKATATSFELTGGLQLSSLHHLWKPFWTFLANMDEKTYKYT